jgi:TRAP transporter TAXI family solute receptor
MLPMPRNRKVWWGAGATVAALVATIGLRWLPSDPAELPPLVVAAGEPGGVYHAYGEGLAAAARARLGATVTVRSTAASVENLRLVASGEADIGFALADVAACAARGGPPFARPLRVVALARLYDNYVHVVVRADAPIHRLTDLAARRVSVGAAESGTALMADRLLSLAGVDPQAGIIRYTTPIAESAAALRQGSIDAFFWSGGLPTQAVAELAKATPIRLLNLAEYVEPLRERYGEYFSELSIPADTYGIGHEVATIGVPNYLVVSDTMPVPVAEAVTRLLFDAKRDLVAAHPEAMHLNRRVAIATFPLRLHPGAALYYRSVKVAIA